MANKILIVDDEPNNLDVLRNSLREAGFKVLVAKNGETALKQVDYIKPDLILLDVMMPDGIDGFETCHRLKKNKVIKDIPIIFLTAKTETVDKIKGLEVGAVDYITKPFNIEEIVARVKTHITIHNLQKCLEKKNVQLEQANQQLQEEIKRRKQIELALQLSNDALRQSLEIQKSKRQYLHDTEQYIQYLQHAKQSIR